MMMKIVHHNLPSQLPALPPNGVSCSKAIMNDTNNFKLHSSQRQNRTQTISKVPIGNKKNGTIRKPRIRSWSKKNGMSTKGKMVDNSHKIDEIQEID